MIFNTVHNSLFHSDNACVSKILMILNNIFMYGEKIFMGSEIFMVRKMYITATKKRRIRGTTNMS